MKYSLIPLFIFLIIVHLTSPCPAEDSEQDKNIKISAGALYGWYFRELVVAKGDMKAQYIQGVADFKKDIFEGGFAGLAQIFGSTVQVSYLGTGKFSFNDSTYHALSLTIDIPLFSLEDSGSAEKGIHFRYKQNHVTASKDFGDLDPGYLDDVTQDYKSDWYNAAIVYFIHMFHKTAGDPYIDGKFWGGISSGGFKYESGIDWTDYLGTRRRYELYLDSQNICPGVTIGFDTVFGSNYDTGLFIGLGIDSVFVLYAPVDSSLAKKDRMTVAIIEMTGFIEYRFNPYLKVTLSGLKVLNQSVAMQSDDEGITFIEDSKNVQGAVTFCW